MLGHPVIGGSWEGFSIEKLIGAALHGSEASFYWSSGGAEIDVLLTLPGGAVRAIEIRRTTAAKVTRAFYTAADDLGVAERLLVYAGDREVSGQGSLRAMPPERCNCKACGDRHPLGFVGGLPDCPKRQNGADKFEGDCGSDGQSDDLVGIVRQSTGGDKSHTNRHTGLRQQR